MRLEHIGIYAHDTDALREWYENVLGMKMIRKLEKEGRPPIFFLAGEGGLKLEILPSSSREIRRELSDPGYSHLGIAVDDFEATARSLSAKGINLHDVRTTSTGWTIGYFEDPEGNRLEIVYRPEETEKTETIYIEVSKCRGCGSCELACSFAKYRVFNPSKCALRLDHDVETGRTAPVISPVSCDLCGGDPACVRTCPYGALVAVEPEGVRPKILAVV